MLATLPFLRTLTYGFVFDDVAGIVQNLALHGWGAPARALALWHHELVNYRPIRFVSLAVDWNLGSGAPWLFHATNVALHAACAALLCAVALRLRLPRATALAAAAVFAVLPAHVGTVAYVSARKDLLVTAFYLAAVLLFLSYRERGGWWRAAAVVAVGALAALCKESAVTLPVALLLADVWCAARDGSARPWRAALRARTAFWALWAALTLAFVVYALWIRPGTAVPRQQWGAVFVNLGTALHVLAVALAQLALPWRSVPDWWGTIAVGAGWSARSVVGAALALSLVAAAWRARRRQPAVLLGVWFLLLSWIPTSGILPITEVFAEHYLYLPSCGFCLALGGLAASGLRRVTSAALARGAALVALAGLAVWAALLSGAWANETTVWESSLRANPRSFRAATNLAGLYQSAGRGPQARDLARRAVDLAPDSPLVAANLAGILLQQGDAAGAADIARQALQRFPTSEELQEILGMGLAARGELAAAAQVRARLAEQAPTARNLGMFGETLCQLGQLDQMQRAEDVLMRAVNADSTYGQAWTNLGLARYWLGKLAASETALRRAIALEPTDPDPYNNMAVVLLQEGRAREAAEYARRSVQLGRGLHPGFERALRTALGQAPAPGGPAPALAAAASRPASAPGDSQ